MKPFAPLRTALLLALLASLPVQAQIYQYKDASGKTVISDRPPPAGKTASKTFSSGASSAEDAPAGNGAAGSGGGNTAAGPKTLSEREMDFKKRQQEQREAAEKAQKEAATKAARDENCERARRQLQVLESGERVATRDAQGERVFIVDEQRDAEIERTRKYIAEACK